MSETNVQRLERELKQAQAEEKRLRLEAANRGYRFDEQGRIHETKEAAPEQTPPADKTP